jgi:hypothetical protein
MVDDISGSAEILGEMFTIGSLFMGQMKRFDNFDGGFLFFDSDLLHDDVVGGLTGIITRPEVVIEHCALIIKIINVIQIKQLYCM